VTPADAARGAAEQFLEEPDLKPAEPVVLTERHATTLVVTLNKPERLNALSPRMLASLRETFEAAAADPGVRALVVTGAGRGFCAGADLNPDPADVGNFTRVLRESFSPLVLRLASIPKPVIAALNGAVAGAGLGLACAADIRLASSTAKFVPGFIKIGVVPDLGASYHVPRIIGYQRALKWLLSGATLTADEALQIGLVDSVGQPDEVLGSAIALAQSLTIGTPTAVALTKALLREAMTGTLPGQLERECELQKAALGDPGQAAAKAAVAATLAAPGDRS
jgi:2-(1,2-epoxy-1,2-dihydrophenyl)acetyl-CoA isomerase